MAKLKDGYYKQTAEAIGSDLHVLLAGGGSKALSDFATTSGVVTALGTNGDYVTWTKNGTANNLTVPYATYAALLSKQGGTASAVATWNPKTSWTKVWGQNFTDSSISSDTGDILYYLRASEYGSGTTELCVVIDGDYYAGVGQYKVWHAGNDGSGSGLDADLLDGQHGSYYAAASSLGNYLPLSGGIMTGALDLTNSPNSADGYKMGLNTSGHMGGGIHFKKNGNNDWGQAITWSQGDDKSQAGIYVKSSGAYGTKMYLCTTNLFADGSKAAIEIDAFGKIKALRNNFVGNLTGNASTADSATITGDGTITIVPQYNNEINFGGTNASSALYFGYRAAGSKPIPTSFVFGGSSGSASITASKFIKSGGTEAQLLRADGGVATFNWSGQSGQPTWLWGGNDKNSYYVYNPANFNVNSAITSTVLLTNNTSQAADACYSESPGLRFWRFNGTGNNIGGGDGWIMSWSWNPGSVGGQIYLDDNPSKIMAIRGFDNATKTFNSWSTFLHSSNYTDYTVKKDGTGASGTWGINISGTASNANTLDSIDSTGFYRHYHISSLQNKDLNYANNTYGSWNYGDDNTQKNTPTTTYGCYLSWGSLASSDTATTRNQTAQIGVDCWSDLGRMYVRARQAGNRDVTSMGNWRTVAFTSDIPTSLPANGGNADTVDGYHAVSFAKYYADSTSNADTIDDGIHGGKLYGASVWPLNYYAFLSVGYSNYKMQFNARNNVLYFRAGTEDGLSTMPWVTIIHSGNIGSQSVNYANSAGNADKLDNIDSTGFLQNYSHNYSNTISTAVDISPTLTAGVTRVHISNVEYSSVLTGYDFNNKAWQLRFMPSYNDGIYFRSQGTGTAWKKLAFTSDIPTVTNYYWADQLITNSAKSDATPTFGNVNIKSGTDAGLAIYTSNAYSRIRFYNSANENNATIHYFATAYSGYTFAKDTLNIGGLTTIGAWNNPTMYITQNTSTTNKSGKVGIQTTSPTSTLDVNGDVAANYYKYKIFGSNLPHASGDAWYNVYQGTINSAGDTILLNLSHSFWYTDTDAVSLAITVGYGNASINQISATGGSGIFKKVRVRFDNTTVWIDVLIYSHTASTDTIYVSGLGKGDFKVPTATSDSSNTKAEISVFYSGAYFSSLKTDQIRGPFVQYNYNQWLSPAYLQLGRADTTVYTDRGCIGITDGNLHIDAYKNKDIYLNYYQAPGSAGQESTSVVVKPSGNVGIGTASPSCKLDVNGIQQIYQRGNDNTAFKDLLLLKQQNSTELSQQNWDTSQPSFGIGFRRYWTSGSSPYGETTHAGIYSTVSSNWRGGLVFRTKNNETQGGTHDTTALRLRPDGYALFGNSLSVAGYLVSTSNSCTVTIGSQNTSYCHYETTAPRHWFNKAVYAQGDFYGGSSYNRRLAYVDELPTSLPANGGNADTVDSKHASEFMGCIEGSDFNPSDIIGNYVGMSTQTGISSNWTHIISLDWRGGGTASISGGNNSSWETQLALPTQNRKSIYYRSFSSTAPYDWVELIDSANILSKAIGYLHVHDVRDASRAPNYFPSYTISGWFNSTGTPSSSWYSGIHVKGWTNGYASWELCSYSSTGTSNDYDLYFRNGNNETWGSWKTILNSSNVATYALKNYGADNSRPNGSTFTLPGGANVVSTRSGAPSGNDIGIFYLSDDNAFICNSSDSSYLFATFDTDKTANFSSADNAAFVVLSDHAGVKSKGDLSVGGLIKSTCNGLTLTIGSQNTSWCHYSTDAPCHWFNKQVEINGALTPHSNNAYSLGSSTKMWGDFYTYAGYISTTLSTALPTYSNAPLKFGKSYNNNDSSNYRYRPWFAGEDLVNSYGYGVTVSCGLYRDPGYSNGGFYIGCGWDDNANSLIWKFSRNGNFYAPGELYATHFYETSDINLKKNIKAILDSDNIPVIKEFDWKSDGTHSYGLIAQELEEQGYSELVSDSGSHKTVNYSAALSLIVGKLQNKIKELEAEIENLKLRA